MLQRCKIQEQQTGEQWYHSPVVSAATTLAMTARPSSCRIWCILPVSLKMPIYARFGFCGFDPTYVGAISMKPQKAHPCMERHHNAHTCRSLKLVYKCDLWHDNVMKKQTVGLQCQIGIHRDHPLRWIEIKFCLGASFNWWRTVASGTWKYDKPEVENVKRRHSPRVWHFQPRVIIISMSHEWLCDICFVVWPTTRNLNYKWLTVAKCEWVSSAI